MPENCSQQGNYAFCKDSRADHHMGMRSWYLTKDEIDNHSPSRRDGIDRVRESSLRKSYCSFLKDLGIKLRVLYAKNSYKPPIRFTYTRRNKPQASDNGKGQ